LADIFEEVEEGLRQEKAARLWKKYGVFAYLAAALLIGGVALNEYLKHQSEQSVEKDALAFEASTEDLRNQNYETAADGLETLVNSDARISPIAANYLAAARLEGNADLAAAIDALELAANTETPIGKVSLMKAAYLKSNSLTRTELESYLGDLMDEESQFGALAIELVAAKAVAEGDIEYARTTFSQLRFLANVPPGVEQRSRAALDALPAASNTPVQETPEETGGADGATDGDQPE